MTIRQINNIFKKRKLFKFNIFNRKYQFLVKSLHFLNKKLLKKQKINYLVAYLVSLNQVS
jgi:hypothetical protein